jgi:thioesterase domain-containing protein
VMVPALLEELRSRDIHVWMDGDRLRCSAPTGVLTPELRDHLRARKRDIVEFLRSAEALARQERAIVPLQPGGDRVPVFAVPGHNGDVFCYRFLAPRLGDDQPFFGLQPPGVDGQSKPLTSVAELAAYFAAQIRAFRPHGPYAIAGYCAGGTVAFELARQLVQGGAPLSFLALFAPSYPTFFRALPELRQRFAERVRSVRKHVRALRTLSLPGRRSYIAQVLRERQARRAAARLAPPDPVLALRVKVQDATRAGVRRYTPQYLAGRVCLFLPNREWLERDNPNAALRWRAVARETVEYCGPDGCEGDVMLLEAYADAIAELFRRCRDTYTPGATPTSSGRSSG